MVKKLEELGIGRPSTYAPTISTIINRKYVEKGNLEKYVGNYKFNSSSGCKTYLKDDILYVFVPGQPEYELVAVGNNKFDFKKIPGYAVLFEMNDNGTTSSLTFKQPNGNFKATKK